MDRLPRVLRDEVIDFLHGNRKHWMKQYGQAQDHLTLASHLAQTSKFGPGRGPGSNIKYWAITCGYDAHSISREFIAFMKSSKRSIVCDTREEYDVIRGQYRDWRLSIAMSLTVVLRDSTGNFAANN